MLGEQQEKTNTRLTNDNEAAADQPQPTLKTQHTHMRATGVTHKTDAIARPPTARPRASIPEAFPVANVLPSAREAIRSHQNFAFVVWCRLP